jgi:hypothetical protein
LSGQEEVLEGIEETHIVRSLQAIRQSQMRDLLLLHLDGKGGFQLFQ